MKGEGKKITHIESPGQGVIITKPEKIFGYADQPGIGRFRFIEELSLPPVSLEAAFSHGLPRINMSSIIEATPEEGYANTLDFFKRAGFIGIHASELPTTILLAGESPIVQQITEAWIQQQTQEKGIIEVDANFVWGKASDISTIFMAIKSADCPTGIIVGQDTEGEVYYGLFHSGWKQTNHDIVIRGITAMKHSGCLAETMQAGIAPSIGSQQYRFHRADSQKLLDPLIWSTFISKPTIENDPVTGRADEFVHVNVFGCVLNQISDAGISHIEVYDPEEFPQFNTYLCAIAEKPTAFSQRAASELGAKNGRDIRVYKIRRTI